MSRFLIGDELGHIKTIRYDLRSPGSSDTQIPVPRTIYTDNADLASKKHAVQALAVGSVQSNGSQLVCIPSNPHSIMRFIFLR